jgi:CRISPR-associated protein Cmr6
MPKMMREGLAVAFNRDQVNHAGLLFSRGLEDWDEDDGKRGKAFGKFIKRLTSIPAPEAYRKAYARWKKITDEEPGRFARWVGQIDGRLFLGLGGAHVLETNVILNRTYGVPLIPGSALKGLARAHARNVLEDEWVRRVLFGFQSAAPDAIDEAGYLLFHDAWWVPDPADTPLTAEVVTVHHPEYYGSRGRIPATDCDSPNPSHQVAIRGSFLFVVEGVEYWAQLGMQILRDALENVGIGGKTASGYGYFVEDKKHPVDLRAMVEGWSEKELCTKFGKDFDKTQARDDFEQLLTLVAEIHGDTIRAWKDVKKNDNKSQYRAYKKLKDLLAL